MTRTRIPITSTQRRAFLKAMAGTGLLAALERNVALAQGAPDYRALVCIYLQGGNDGENTLVRYDTAGYQNYASVRPPASGVNIARSQLLPVQPASTPFPLGFHSACGPWQSAFNAKSLAIVANMGMLVKPSTRGGLESGATPRPANLGSHPDQELSVQTADPRGYTRVGWGGRVADLLDSANPGTLFPPLTSLGGLRMFAAGQTSIPLAMSPGPYFTLYLSGIPQFDALRNAALQEALALRRDNVYQVAAQVLSQEGFSAADVVGPMLQDPNSVVTPHFAGLTSGVASALMTAAKVIEGRDKTGMRRQIFFINQGGYDTHGNQLFDHGALLGDLSSATKAFYDALGSLGLASSVTTFTLSDFGRTFKPASNAGTDHGWGNYAFVMGGAVKGGDVYGTLPALALNGPDDLGKDGRWIPTTSIEQYGATLCRWFGIAEGDLPYVFPNIAAFPNTSLGFMS